MIRQALCIALAVGTAAAADAEVIPLPPFEGDAVESFESYPIDSEPPDPLTTEVGVITGQLVIIDDLHADGDRCARSSALETIYRLTFPEPVHDFGAYWTCWPTGGACEFWLVLRDENDVNIEYFVIDHGSPFALEWRGWHSDVPIASVVWFSWNGWPILDSVRISYPWLLCQRSDFDGDGHVGLPDFLQLLADWGTCSGCSADINQDGTVDVQDFLRLLSDWGVCP
jgi:hypothetical protein